MCNLAKKKGHIDRPMAELLTHTHSHTHMWRRKHEKVPGDKINLCIRNELRDTQGASSQQQQQQQDNNNSNNNNHTMGTGCHFAENGKLRQALQLGEPFVIRTYCSPAWDLDRKGKKGRVCLHFF